MSLVLSTGRDLDVGSFLQVLFIRKQSPHKTLQALSSVVTKRGAKFCVGFVFLLLDLQAP